MSEKEEIKDCCIYCWIRFYLENKTGIKNPPLTKEIAYILDELNPNLEEYIEFLKNVMPN